VVFAYGGWQTASYVGGEIKDPRRNLALALMIGVAGVVALYLAVNVACLRALGPTALGASSTPAADVLRVAFGAPGAKFAALAIAISTLGYLSQGMLTAPRVYYAMAKDGLFFRQLAAVTEKGRTPAVAIIVQAVWTMILALSGSYERILSYVVATNFLFFAVTGAAVFVFRAREKKAPPTAPAERGFRIPLHPISTLLFIVACLVVVASSFWADPIDSLIGYGILIVGVPIYYLWRMFVKTTPEPDTQ
jgi:APA family basic amino acid/polyamine antiporter